jgi:general secretion pathway protein N
VGVVFVITLVVRLPARALTALLPADLVCDAPSGTVWVGTCGALRAGSVSIAGLSWQLQPAALLHLQLGAALASQDPAAHGRAQVRLAPNGDVQVTAVDVTLSLPGELGQLPAGASGNLQLAIDSAHLQGGHLVDVQGTITLLQLHIANPAADLGSFELQFVPPDPNAAIDATSNSAIVGQLRDLDGPLSVIGVLQLTRGGSYDLEGSVAPKPDSGADLTQVLQLLGPPDAQGRRPFSVGGTL